jgi:hypothetical protein
MLEHNLILYRQFVLGSFFWQKFMYQVILFVNYVYFGLAAVSTSQFLFMSYSQFFIVVTVGAKDFVLITLCIGMLVLAIFKEQCYVYLTALSI